MTTDDLLRRILEEYLWIENKKNYECCKDQDCWIDGFDSCIAAIKEIMVEKDMVEVHEYWTKKIPSVKQVEEWLKEWVDLEWDDLAKFIVEKIEGRL